eukprot:GHVL01004549.1.p2 GENE.GHVL01004549.1~~GHVL01004549.1.p2  ORF type:complete len:165 (-),score=14.99 GHVL01004549.1:1380-1874(-)
MFNAAKRVIANIVDGAKRAFYSSQISDCFSSKQLFTITNRLIGRKKVSPLPNSHDTESLPDTFCRFFLDKVNLIRTNLDSHSSPSDPKDITCVDSSFDSFDYVSMDMLRTLILKSKPCTCSLDPLPTSLFVECLDELLPRQLLSTLSMIVCRLDVFPLCTKPHL